jgi:uncharacterized delta-60 repeat protein
MTRWRMIANLKRLQIIVALLLTFTTLTYFWPARVHAADGDLDAGFGTGQPTVPAGVARTDFGANQNDFVFALGRQSVGVNAGKIVAGGYTQNTMTGLQDFALTRYTTSGALDTTFGPGMTGKVTTDFNPFSERLNDLAIASGDKIVAVGGTTSTVASSCSLTNNDIAIAVYNADGSPDMSFDMDGKRTLDISMGCSEQASAVVIQPDGKIVVAGVMDKFNPITMVNDSFLVLVRLNPDGSLDGMFGSGGVAQTDINANALGGPADLVLIPSGPQMGKFIAVGLSNNLGDFFVARFTSSGNLDSGAGGFGPTDTGVVTTSFSGGTDLAESVVLQPDGKIIAAGTANFFGGPTQDFAMARYDSDGNLDTNADADPGVVFGTAGKVTTDFSGGGVNRLDQGQFVGVMANGKIVMVGGFMGDDGMNGVGLARYNSDGSLDTTFGADMNGKVRNTLSTGMTMNAATPNAGLLQPDGKILAGGQLNAASGNDIDFFVARFLNGGLDCTLSCPANITTSNSPNQCGATVTFPTPTETGTQCGGKITCSPTSGSFFPVGNTSVTCSDSAGPSCSFTVTVNDTQNPAVTCPANISTGESSPGSGSNTVNYPVPAANDNCPGATTMCSPASGSSFAVGTTTVTCTATDASGNTGTCMFTVTVSPCTITCPANITVSNDPNQCGAVVNYPAPTTGGTCGTINCSPPSGSFFPKGTTTVTCTTTAGPSCSFTVTVNDTQPPSVTCPANVTAVAQQTCPPTSGAVVNYPAPTVSDNCPGVTAVCSPPSGSTFSIGTTTVTCTATDAAGNTATCSFGVTVFSGCLQDESNPSLVVLFNASTGEYRLCCGGTIFTGVGQVTVKGCVVTIQHNPADRRVLIKADFAVKSGTASLQFPPGTTRCTITDKNTSNNSCQCP